MNNVNKRQKTCRGTAISVQDKREFAIPDFHISELALEDRNSDRTDTAVLAERQLVTEAVNTCFQNQNTESTIQTYEAFIKQEVGQAQVALNAVLLPLDNEQKFLVLFG